MFVPISFFHNVQRELPKGFFCGILWKVFIRHFSAVPAVVLFIFLVAHLSVIVLLSQVTAPTFEQMLLIWLHIYISSLNVLFSFFKADTADETAWSFFFLSNCLSVLSGNRQRSGGHTSHWLRWSQTHKQAPPFSPLALFLWQANNYEAMCLLEVESCSSPLIPLPSSSACLHAAVITASLAILYNHPVH